MRRPDLSSNGSPVQQTDYICPHCGVLQAVVGRRHNMSAFAVTAFQCIHCEDLQISMSLFRLNGSFDGSRCIYPANANRLAKSFVAAPAEVEAAYVDACLLYGVHVGASGAYSRRALELILDGAGYKARSLADSIGVARLETDPDKRLPKRLLQKLDYIKEIGNFALHVRRDDELTIVAISAEEVAACLETIEDLIAYLFDEPVAEYQRTLVLNDKLKAAGKREIALPELPPGVAIPAHMPPAAEAQDAV